MTIARKSNRIDTRAHRPSMEQSVPGIDINNLAWVNFEPCTEPTSWRRSLRIASKLMTPGAWVVVQTNQAIDPAWLESEGFQLIETFGNEAPAGDVLSIYLMRKVI